MLDSEVRELLIRAQQGDMEAFAGLFEPLRPIIFSVASRMVGANDAEDVVMETFLKAWQAIPRFRGGSSLKTWLFRIAHNQAIDWLRSRERQRTQSLADDESGTDPMARLPHPNQKRPDEIVIAEEDRLEVTAALHDLPEEHRIALMLRYSDGLEYSEIAAATGVSIGTVMSRLFYGKKKLQAILKKGEDR
jgi:RNA polymerase sigma-70 factor (ECF subfamily)